MDQGGLMSDGHATTVDRLQQFRADRLSRATDRTDKAADDDAIVRGTLRIGTRVLDLETGLDGNIVERFASMPMPFGMFAVRLDNGNVVPRFRQKILLRPTPPRA
jgi:hypothetical protein